MGKGKSEYRPHRFSVKDTALLLGISESYLGTLDREHSMIARRTERGKPFYTASDIAILREMGVGKRPKRLRPTGEAIRRLGLYCFGGEPHESNPQAMLQARAAKPMEERAREAPGYTGGGQETESEGTERGGREAESAEMERGGRTENEGMESQ